MPKSLSILSCKADVGDKVSFKLDAWYLNLNVWFSHSNKFWLLYTLSKNLKIYLDLMACVT